MMSHSRPIIQRLSVVCRFSSIRSVYPDWKHENRPKHLRTSTKGCWKCLWSVNHCLCFYVTPFVRTNLILWICAQKSTSSYRFLFLTPSFSKNIVRYFPDFKSHFSFILRLSWRLILTDWPYIKCIIPRLLFSQRHPLEGTLGLSTVSDVHDLIFFTPSVNTHTHTHRPPRDLHLDTCHRRSTFTFPPVIYQ